MAKSTIIFEDLGTKSVSMMMDVEGVDGAQPAATYPSVVLTLATHALFDTGLLAEAGAVALEAMSEGKVPTECILAHFNAKKAAGNGDGGPHTG